jgi:acetylornithine deacetylase/succinyl-diaminopimelate desuccinylase-like protein
MGDLVTQFPEVDAVRDEVIALNQALVRIPSVNTGSMPTGNETEVCEYVRRWLAEDGIASEILESAPGRGNIIAWLEGRYRALTAAVAHGMFFSPPLSLRR